MNGISWGEVQPINLLNDTAIIVGSGPSLTGFDFNKLKGLGTIITVNDSVKGVPFADLWFTLDPWGLHGPQLPPSTFKGKMYAAVPEDFGTLMAHTVQHRTTPNKNITFLHRLRSHNKVGVSSETAYKLGLSEDKSCINTGNSGYGALGLAYHLRPKKVLLLGIDGNIGYFYTKTKQNRALTYLPKMFESAVPQLKAADIEVINGSVNSAVKCFPRLTVSEALKEISV